MSEELDLWQQTLAAEHAAIWVYGLVGATTSMALPAEAALRVHRERRTRCVDEVVALGGQPNTSAPAYDVAAPTNPTEASDLAATVEQSCTVVYAALAGAAGKGSRLLAAQWLRESAIAMWGWDGELPVLPGLE
ncbi:MAG: ferritin-like domain-containing protein [Actinomycetia bacterium]|nr:ferritin-like domain-containing protein [Actinomycetes bacterium]